MLLVVSIYDRSKSALTKVTDFEGACVTQSGMEEGASRGRVVGPGSVGPPIRFADPRRPSAPQEIVRHMSTSPPPPTMRDGRFGSLLEILATSVGVVRLPGVGRKGISYGGGPGAG